MVEDVQNPCHGTPDSAIVLNGASTAVRYQQVSESFETYATMIDYIALSIGHGLLGIAVLRLVMRDGLDVDPLLDSFKQKDRERRKQRNNAGRAAHRRREGRGQGSDETSSKGMPGQ
ncbi:MAG: hypothetical protein AAFR64_10370 [Pseudomonadota bacterium]